MINANCQFKQNRSLSFLFIIAIYITAIIIGTIVFRLCIQLETLFITGLAAADIAATLWVFLWSVFFKNVSVYDPYWSVAPWVLLCGTMIYANSIMDQLTPSSWLLFIVISFWSWRLTFNWAQSFNNLSVQDWRYTQFMEKHPKTKYFISFFGFHFMPTVIVYLCCIPLFYAATWYSSGRVVLSAINPASLPGAIISIGAVFLQLAADISMRHFRSNSENSTKVNNTGIWAFCRHPNYLGEILMWWGIWLCSMGVCTAPGISGSSLPWWTFIGALTNTLMFIFISIPLMEKRQLERRPEYREYINTTGMLLPKLRGRKRLTGF